MKAKLTVTAFTVHSIAIVCLAYVPRVPAEGIVTLGILGTLGVFWVLGFTDD